MRWPKIPEDLTSGMTWDSTKNLHSLWWLCESIDAFHCNDNGRLLGRFEFGRNPCWRALFKLNSLVIKVLDLGQAVDHIRSVFRKEGDWVAKRLKNGKRGEFGECVGRPNQIDEPVVRDVK